MLTKKQKERFDRNGYTYPKEKDTPIIDFFDDLTEHILFKPTLFLIIQYLIFAGYIGYITN